MSTSIARKINRGFTLIEIMIVVIIVGILASIAYPSYLDHVRRGHETEAKGQIMDAASALEAHRAKNFTYSGATLAAMSSSLNSNQHYSAVLALGNNNQSYTITATATGSLMSGMPTLTLNSSGVASWD